MQRPPRSTSPATLFPYTTRSRSVDRDVERIACGRERPLGVDAGGARKLDPGAEVEARRIAIVAGRGRARLGNHLIGQGFEIGAVALEPGDRKSTRLNSSH